MNRQSPNREKFAVKNTLTVKAVHGSNLATDEGFRAEKMNRENHSPKGGIKTLTVQRVLFPPRFIGSEKAKTL